MAKKNNGRKVYAKKDKQKQAKETGMYTGKKKIKGQDAPYQGGYSEKLPSGAKHKQTRHGVETKPELPFGYELETSVSKQFGKDFPASYSGLEGWRSEEKTTMKSDSPEKGLKKVGEEKVWNPSARSTEAEAKAKAKKGKEAKKKHDKAKRKSKMVKIVKR